MLETRRTQICDACRIAPARTDGESEFFLCDVCEATVVIEFLEFELPMEAARRPTISGRRASGPDQASWDEAWPNRG